MSRILAAFVLLAAAACSPAGDQQANTQSGSGSDESRTYDLKDFDRVSAKAGVKLILKQGPFAVEARSRNGDLGKLIVEVRGSELVVSRETTVGGVNISQPSYTVTATAPAWTAIEGLAGVEIDGENLRLDNVAVRAAAGTSVELSGTCKEISVEAAAGASVDADDLRCAVATAEASAGAKVDLHATERARGEASAGAVIEVSGNPPAFEQDADISSTVKLD